MWFHHYQIEPSEFGGGRTTLGEGGGRSGPNGASRTSKENIRRTLITTGGPIKETPLLRLGNYEHPTIPARGFLPIIILSEIKGKTLGPCF